MYINISDNEQVASQSFIDAQRIQKKPSNISTVSGSFYTSSKASTISSTSSNQIPSSVITSNNKNSGSSVFNTSNAISFDGAKVPNEISSS
jgi:hypothetical protein